MFCINVTVNCQCQPGSLFKYAVFLFLAAAPAYHAMSEISHHSHINGYSVLSYEPAIDWFTSTYNVCPNGTQTLFPCHHQKYNITSSLPHILHVIYYSIARTMHAYCLNKRQPKKQINKNASLHHLQSKSVILPRKRLARRLPFPTFPTPPTRDSPLSCSATNKHTRQKVFFFCLKGSLGSHVTTAIEAKSRLLMYRYHKTWLTTAVCRQVRGKQDATGTERAVITASYHHLRPITVHYKLQ